MSWKLTCMLQKYHKKYRNSVNSFILYKTKIISNVKYNMLLSHE